MSKNNKKKNTPDGWQTKQLGDLGRVSMCKRILKSQTSEDGDIPFFKIGTFGKEPDAYITKEVYVDFKSKYSFPKKGDILISASGTIGRAVVYDGRPAYYQDSNIIWIANDENTVINPYLRYLYDKVQWQTASGTIARLYNDNVRRIEIVAPEIPEQKRIVKVLETWDEAIEKLGNMIALKREVKKGLMQKLLTGDLRLPGFKGEFSLNTLENVSKISMGQSPTSDTYNEKGIGLPLIQGNNDIKYRKTIKRVWTSKPTKVAEAGSIVMTVRAPVGLIGLADEKVCIGRGVCAINATSINPTYLYHYLISFENRWARYEQGSTFTAVNGKDIRGLEITYHTSTSEQLEVARVLGSADNELQLLTKKLNILKDQKKYLLNNLVTGQIRTPENL